jgi:LL-diaminopimelate aminotransferase
MRKKIVIERAERLHKIPSSLFWSLERKARRAAARGVDVIDLSLVNPRKPPSERVVDELCRAARQTGAHRYMLGYGLDELRRKVADWYESRFGVSLNPELEVLPLQGAWEGLWGLPMAFVNPRETVLLTDPCYPIYRAGTMLAGGQVDTMALLERNDFLPNLKQVPGEVAYRAKLMFLNYPNNPTAAVADVAFFSEVVDFARQHNIAVVHDATYVPLRSDRYQAPSFLQARGAKSLGVELFSLSMWQHLGGWRIGFAVGNRQLLAGLMAVRGCGYVNPPWALQKAAALALVLGKGAGRDPFAERRTMVVNGLRKVGLKVVRPGTLPFLWVSVPGRYTSLGFSRRLFRRTGILVTPGSAFGEHGEGFFRLSLTASEDRLRMALRRIRENTLLWQRKRRTADR